MPTDQPTRIPWLDRSGWRYWLAVIWTAYPAGMWVAMIGIILSTALVAVLSIWVASLRGLEAIGSTMWMMAVVAWIVFVDARKRWPHLNAMQRWTSVATVDSSQDRIARAYQDAQAVDKTPHPKA